MIGTVGADVTITGLIALPFMLQRGYDKHMALGSIVAGGALGVLIPPSIMFIVYGVTVGESIGKLFIAGIVPGIMMMGLFFLWAYIQSTLYTSAQMRSAESLSDGATRENYTWAEKIRYLPRALPFIRSM